ncbi:transcription factor Pig1p [Fusarium pseudoanthophilum]|uniref:Transcription factor Pig1p n=1 Tax=Fusarium pseudoanthophilum TaxID=48495 RepID=A0A8H5PQN8_9HYPO|nr:transcription factor Pig1p [Fusarium pseudoanthophilum]
MSTNISKTDTGTHDVRNDMLGGLRLRNEETNEIILIPTPTNDPNDPLNWSKAYRFYIAVLVSCAIFFSNFLAAGPSVAIVSITESYFGPPGPDFSAKVSKIAYFFTTTALLQGMGNLIWMPFVAKYGRRPTYVLSFIMYTAVAAWAGGATTYGSALAARILMGFASGVAECLAPLTISDLFFLHERGAAMAIYTTALSAGVGVGIIVAGLITINLSWRYIYWVSVALIGVCTILIILTFPETVYNRQETTEGTRPHIDSNCKDQDQDQDIEKVQFEEASTSGHVSYSPPPKRTFVQNLSLYSGTHTKESILKLFFRPVVLLTLPPVLWATLVMSVTIGFLVAISSNFAVAFSATYGFKPWQAGLCFISCPIGAGAGAFFGGYFSDKVADRLTRKNGGIREPEMRLPAILISLVIAPLSLVLYGVGIDRSWHWIVPTIGLGLLNMAIVQATNVSLVYTIDSYRPVAGELAVTQLAFKSAFGFLLSFYTNPWIDISGYANAFGAMAGISGAVILCWVPIYIWGRRIRHATWSWGYIEKFVHWNVDREMLKINLFGVMSAIKPLDANILKRHVLAHNGAESGVKRYKRMSNAAPRVSQACKACAGSKLKCDEDASCRRCVAKGIPCERDTRFTETGDKTSPDTSIQSTIDQELSIPVLEPSHLSLSEDDFSKFLKGVMTPVEGQESRPIDQADLTSINHLYNPLPSHGLLDFRVDGDTRFDDVAMDLWDLPCSPSFYYNGILLEPKASLPVNTAIDPPNPVRPAVLGHVAYKESALGMWEPSQNDHLNSNIKALSVLGDSPQDAIQLTSLELSSQQQFKPLSVGLRDQLLLLTLNACKPESKLAIIRAFPHSEILSKLIESFFSHHRVQTDSWIHGPSFEPNQQGAELILTIVNMGTMFADSKILHSLGFALHEVARLSLPVMFERANSMTRALWALQAFVLDIEMGLWSGIKRKMEIAESQRQMPFTMLRRGRRFSKTYTPAEPPLPEDAGEILQNKWLAWVEQENYNRLTYHCFIMDTQVSIAMSTCPLISFSELKTPLPDSSDLWLAKDAEAWKAIYLRQQRQPTRLTLYDYFRNGAEVDSSYDGSFCQLVVVSGIWGMVWQCLQSIAVLDKPRHSDPALTLRQQEILQILHRFRVNMMGDEASWHDGPVTMMYHLVYMHLHIPFEEVELFAGKGHQSDARHALSVLLDWTNSPESRKAIWYAGQIIRAAEMFEPGRLRGFYTIALYQANLAFWAYAVVSQVKGTNKNDSILNGEEIVCLNGPESPLVQRFISRGVPSVAVIQPSALQHGGSPIRLMDREAVVNYVLSILSANFSHVEAVPPLVENLEQLLDKLGRAEIDV